ncbi:MAG: ArsR/SmtB family transcription factor [Acidimicrobiales bacterium]
MQVSERVLGSDDPAGPVDGRVAGRVDAGIDDAVRLAELFRLLGDPNRIRILMALGRAGELCVHDLAAAVAAPEAKVSQALRLLRTAGVVRNRREGRHVHYRLDDDHVRTLLEMSHRHIAHGPGDPTEGEPS